MSFKCQIFTTRLTFHNVLELSCDVRIIILFSLIAILPPNIKCAKLPNPQIRLLINDEDLLHEKTSRHEAGGANVQPEHSGEHFNLYRSELKRLSYETIHRILRDENEPSYRREDTELRYYQKRSPSAYEENHQLIKRSAAAEAAAGDQGIALNYSKRKLKEFIATPQLEKELHSASSLDLSDNHLSAFSLSLLNDRIHTLNLSNNSFSSIPLSENTTLRSLNLNANSIRESALTSNVYLHNLYLSSNNIENLAAVNLSLLKNLEILDISCNRLKSLETSFFPERMHNLKHLNLAHNQLGTIYRETFYNLLSLNTLLLAHNNITDIDYETFLALPNLQYLDLSFNRLKGKSIRALQGITGLMALKIAFNAELGPYMQEFVASWSLKELDASGTGLCQIPAALAQSVRSLKLTHNWLQIINCGDLDSYPLLQYLDLSFSHIEHIEDDALGRLEILEVLMLDHNQLAKIPVSLPVSLEQLFLQNNNIMDIQSQSFQGLSSLKTLDLSHNKLLYLPDVSLAKLQTLNLQSAEIRGISQGIVHTLPRLNELFLEDNPIKCSDLLGIAEWASTCRLRSTKDEMQENEGGAELADDEGIDNEGKVELKKKFEKMHNFYDKFEGEHCQKHIRFEEVATTPSCAVVKDKPTTQTIETHHLGASQLESNLKRSSVAALEQEAKVENFDLNAMIAIPLPAKKTVKTLTETANQATATIAVTTAVEEVNEATTNPLTSATPATPKATASNATPATPAATFMQIKGNLQQNNNSTKTYILATKTSSVIATPTTLAEAIQTFKEFAFKEKPQEHSNQAKKTFARTTAATATATAPAVKGIAMEMADNATIVEALQQQQVVGVISTSAESLRAANLQETLKQNAAKSIIKKYIKWQTTLTTATTQMPPTTAVDIALALSHATAINSTKPKPVTATTMATTETTTAASTPTGTTLSSTTTIAATATATAASKSKINLFKEIVQNEKEIKTKIGPTKEIKSFETSTIAPALPPTSTRTGTTIASSQDSFPNAMFDVSSSNTTNKELTVSTTSTTVVMVQAISALSSLPSLPSTASTPTITVPITTATATATSPTLMNSGGDAAITLEPLQPTSPSTSMATATAATSKSASFQDKDLASTKDNNIGQDNGQDNWNGQNNNKTLVTLHITTPIIPHIVPQSNENHPLAKEQHQHQRQETRQVQDVEHENAAIQHQSLTTTSNDVNAAKCMQSNAIECTSARPQRHETKEEGRAIGKMPATTETISPLANKTPMPAETMAFSTSTTTTAAVIITATSTTAGAATSSKPTATTHKHEPLQLHIKDRHLIGTPLLMHKGDNLMVAADELMKPNSAHDPHKIPMRIPTPTPLLPSSTSASSPLPPPATGSSQTAHHELIRKAHTLDKSQNQKFQESKTSKAQRHHEPFEHKGETIKDKDYVQYKKSNADMKTKKPSLIMKKMTIITKQHEAVTGEEKSHAHDENEIHHQKDLMPDSHYQELKPLHKDWEGGPPKHSTVNTPIKKKPSLQHEPQTFQHEHELMLQQILHDQQQQQHGKVSQSEQWSDLRKTTEKDNHPGLILLVSSGLFVVLLLGLMHVYRCDVPWRRNSPAHHLRPHQRHNGSLEDDVHSFLSYNEGMQKWHHSTRLEAPYSSPLHNLHVRELQKTSATEKAATFKAASSYNRHLNRTHILPRTNSQSSTATTRTTSPSSSAILDDETFYIEMTPSTGQFAQALQSEFLPMELLKMAQTTKHETKETSADFQFSLDEDADFNAATSSSLSTSNHQVATRSDLLAPTSSASAASATTTSFNHSNKTLYSTRKFGLW